MYACIALCLLLGASADRLGHQREIDARYNQVPKLLDYVLNQEFISAQKNKAKLVTKLRPDEAVVADNLILESNVVKIVKPRLDSLVRQRRGYNLENVIVPARYPYLPVVRYNRFRRWG